MNDIRLNEKNKNFKYILGIEGSANKLGISIINGDMKILVNMRRTFVSEIGCGFIPREISLHHKYYIVDMIQSCLNKLNIKITDISLICYTKGPGIGSALYVGYNICKILFLLFNIPVIGVNHCIAHIEMGIFITKLYHPIILYVSGSNTQIIYFNDHKKRYEIIGETLDIAIGNIIDRSARILKISNSPSPGYNVELLARKKYMLNILKKQKNKAINILSEENKLKNMNMQNKNTNDININIIDHVKTEDNDSSLKESNVINTKCTAKNNDANDISNDNYDYTELLFFPYTIKGMDISFSGYDFYITKYFSKYINKNIKKTKMNSKNNKNESKCREYNKNIEKKCKTENNSCDTSSKKEEKLNKNNLKKEEYKNCYVSEAKNLSTSEKQSLSFSNNSSKYSNVINKNEKEFKKDNEIKTVVDEKISISKIDNKLDNTLSNISLIKGNSYYEDNIIYKCENKKNYGDNNKYFEEDCSIETDSDFYEKCLSEEEKEIINLSDEEKRKIQICYSLQHHIFSMLIEITERAISFTNSKEVIIVGGVGCNLFLQNMMKKMAKQKNIKIGFMDHSYCVDNGAMIAYTGYLEYMNSEDKNIYNFENISIHQRYRTDDVLVTWR
ncbi:tRNA N6-adenosine threonylcarbamoyltransferase, putative [Plasmodium gallinaceum]|uniref:N(6)-L-threonylcarbamoyladenine synthase n=1 Tax=Plasmodium gallinaceum TaxID=5849 RepID=A0A1J1GXW1_PLAGA|nr:tRNA N6-adenosine threonylcarbamoyltransferase, putative [Plasmodium gallinaceum]CRG97320.1 tRNA N6-adenosine threonylcarbamoyltransferase, putative [Plasmodium gallinaceum]